MWSHNATYHVPSSKDKLPVIMIIAARLGSIETYMNAVQILGQCHPLDAIHYFRTRAMNRLKLRASH